MSDIVGRLRSGAAHQTLVTTGLVNQAADLIADLRAENEKLRAALELFACDCIDSGNLCPSPQNCRNYIARAALTQEKRDDKA